MKCFDGSLHNNNNISAIIFITHPLSALPLRSHVLGEMRQVQQAHSYSELTFESAASINHCHHQQALQ